MTWAPTWTRIDNHDNLVTSYTIDRGRQYELDRTDVGRATVQIADRDGILDPTNPSGAYHTIRPLMHIALGRHDPVADSWHTRFRGFIAELDYSFHPSQQVNMLTMQCVDLFDVIAAVQFIPGEFGSSPPLVDGIDVMGDQVYYAPTDVQTRMRAMFADISLPSEMAVVFTGNVDLWEGVYSAGESMLGALQECADAEFPGVSNIYVDRFGRFVFHGRLAKYDPAGVLGGDAEGANWDYSEWTCGDGAAIAANAARAQIRAFAFNRGLAKIINQATATPIRRDVPLTPTELKAQKFEDATSIGTFSIRSWTALDLLNAGSFKDGSTDLVDTKRFATFYATNYAQPQNRITDVAFRSIQPGDARALRVWLLLSQIDISDSVEVHVGSPGGGGFTGQTYFVEGIHEQVRALTPTYDDVTLSLDLSPRAYFAGTPPFPT